MRQLLFIPFFVIGMLPSLAQSGSTSILISCKNENIAKVVFFRPFRILGFPLKFDLYVGDSLVTRLKMKTFYVMEVPAGKNAIFAQPVNSSLHIPKSSFELQVEPQKVYFVQCKPTAIINSGSRSSKTAVRSDIRLRFKSLNNKEVATAIRRGFLKRKVKKKLYHDFVSGY